MRNNEERFGAKESSDTPATAIISKKDTLDFPDPTEFVELPTAGRFYPNGHPLHEQETIEIRFMTAKDEDLLVSKALLKKGLVFERLMSNLIVDNKINPNDLYSGDRTAIIVAARISAYGNHYMGRMICPVCNMANEIDFDLSELISYVSWNSYEDYDVELTEDNTFIAMTPKTNIAVEFKLLKGSDEKMLTNLMETKRRKKLPESLLTDQLRTFIVSVNGETDSKTINTFIGRMPAYDSHYLRGIYQGINPNLNMTHDFSCNNCDYEQGEMEVPLNADFFRPQRKISRKNSL